MKQFRVKSIKPNYCGVGAAGVQFAYGEAIINEGWICDWYKEKGYIVEEINENDESFYKKSVPELKAYAEAKAIDLEDAKSKKEIIEKIKAADEEPTE